MTRFLRGLNTNVANTVELYPYADFEELMNRERDDFQSHEDEEFSGENPLDDGDSCSEIFSEEEPLYDEYPVYDEEIPYEEALYDGYPVFDEEFPPEEEYDGTPVYDEEILAERHVFDEMLEPDFVSRAAMMNYPHGKLSNFNLPFVFVGDIMGMQDVGKSDNCLVDDVELKPKEAKDSCLLGPVSMSKIIGRSYYLPVLEMKLAIDSLRRDSGETSVKHSLHFYSFPDFPPYTLQKGQMENALFITEPESDQVFDGSLFGVTYSRHIVQENVQFIISMALNGKIKAWLYDNLGSRVDYEAVNRTYLGFHKRSLGVETIEECVCLREEDHGIVWKHQDGRTRVAAVRRSGRPVVSFICTIANYEYGFYWYFYRDGKIEVEMKVTGILSLGALQPGEVCKNGTMIAPGLYAPVHQHFFVARMDMSVDCKPGKSHNQVVELNVTVEEPGDKNVHNNASYAEVRLLKSELEAMRDCNPLSARRWIIRNTSDDEVGLIQKARGGDYFQSYLQLFHSHTRCFNRSGIQKMGVYLLNPTSTPPRLVASNRTFVQGKLKFKTGIEFLAQISLERTRVILWVDKDGFSVKVKFIDGFQGGEEDMFFLSTVRSNNHGPVGFISSPQRTTVVLTRARHCLRLLDNERTLINCASVWKDLVCDARNWDCLFDAATDEGSKTTIIDAENAAVSRSLQERFNMLIILNEEKSQTDAKNTFYLGEINDADLLVGTIKAKKNDTAVIFEGGYIGLELRTVLSVNNFAVQMVYPEPWCMTHLFTSDIAAVYKNYSETEGVSMIRNTQGSIFGGFLMRRAFELAFASAYIAGSAPLFLEVDHVDFMKPVDVGIFCLKSVLLFTELEKNPPDRLNHHFGSDRKLPIPKKKAVDSVITTMKDIDDDGISELRTIPFKGGGDDTDTEMGTEMGRVCSLTVAQWKIVVTRWLGLMAKTQFWKATATQWICSATQWTRLLTKFSSVALVRRSECDCDAVTSQ